MNLNRTCRAVAATTVVAAASFAQQPADALATPAIGRGLVVPIHTQADDGGVPYGLWAGGDDYKASFDGGMVFVPYGASAGPAPTWSWRTASARVGELELVTHAPRLCHTDLRAEYHLGGVVEAYDVRADGLEQTFVLAQRPAAAGDLVIRGAVASVLQPLASEAGGIAYVDAGGAVRVHYGAAVAIDANGQRRAMATTPVAGGIELRLDAGWLASAAFPLVVDPLLVPVAIASGTTIGAVDVAHDPLGTKGLWFAEVRAVGTDTDVRLIRTEDDGSAPFAVYTDLSANWASLEPSLGINRPAASTAFAFTRHFLNDTRGVRVHVHDRLDLGFDGNWVAIPNVDGRNQWRPSVGHELSPVSFTSLLIAYQVETTGAFSNISTSAIHAAEFACGGIGSVVSQFVVNEVAGVDSERPSVAKVAIGPTRTWTVAFQRYQPFGGGFTWDIGLRRVDAAWAVGAEVVLPNVQASQHEMAPQLAGSDDRLMVFFTASTQAESVAKPNGINGHRFYGQRIAGNGNSVSFPFGVRLLQSNGDARLELSGADFDTISQSHWALMFRSNATETLYMRVYGYQGIELSSDNIDDPTTGLGTSVHGGVCFQENEAEFIAGYGIDEPGVGSYLRMRRRDYPFTPPPATSGSACTSTVLGWQGTQWIGSQQSGVTFANAPAGSATAVVVATQTAFLQIFGVDGVQDGCWLLVPLAGPDFLGVLPPILGSAGNWTLPLPDGLPGMAVYFQGVTYDLATGLHTSSSRLAVLLTK